MDGKKQLLLLFGSSISSFSSVGAAASVAGALLGAEFADSYWSLRGGAEKKEEEGKKTQPLAASLFSVAAAATTSSSTCECVGL